MTDEMIYKILEAFKVAIIKAYKESDDYFNPITGRERSIVFRIAHHLAGDIENKLGLFVDIEATRCRGNVKRAVYGAIARPDLIVHKREGKGYFVAEFKCNKNREQRAHDCAKLSLFTLQDKKEPLKRCCPTYELGAFVFLGNRIDDIRITLFENGEIKKGYKDVALHEI